MHALLFYIPHAHTRARARARTHTHSEFRIFELFYSQKKKLRMEEFDMHCCNNGKVLKTSMETGRVRVRESKYKGAPIFLKIHPNVQFDRCIRENVHLTILRQRILIRRQSSPLKCSCENV